MNDAKKWLAGMIEALKCGAVRPALECLRQDWGRMQVDASVTGRPLCLRGRVYGSGFGTHGNCDLRISLPPGSRRLTGLCGVDDNEDTRGRTADQIFSIELDGREVWTSGPRNVPSPAARFDVPLRGAKTAMLKVRGPIARAHVDWVNLRVDGAKVVPCGSLAPGDILDFRYGGKPSRDLIEGGRGKAGRRQVRGAV
ncbi:MAG: NPCBM/NEW2 domain-containing protein, partial [Planctomycetota bacterium]|nr:NPCBM/NEW2 domain-containing protein [Planctomycetota bacterium]